MWVHRQLGGQRPRPKTCTPPLLSQPPTNPTPYRQGHEIQVNLHIRLIPQDTGLVGGALGKRREESGPLAARTSPHPRVTMGTTYRCAVRHAACAGP